MSTQLWLQEPRTVLDEPGLALHFDFGNAPADTVADWLRHGRLVLDNAVHEPIGGVIMGQPDWPTPDSTHEAWIAEGDGWAAEGLEPLALRHPTEGQWCHGMAFTAPSSAWSLTSREEAAQGESRLVQFLTYVTDSPTCLTATFGGVWRLRLDRDGWARLQRREGDAWAGRATFRWLAAPIDQPRRHTLWVYEVGPKLMVRSLDIELGVAVWDGAAESDELGRPIHHALRRGVWRFEGSDPIILGCRRVTWSGNDSSVALAEAEPAGSYLGVTQPIRPTIWGWASDGAVRPTVELWDQDGQPYPQVPAAPASSPATSLGWRLTWRNDDELTWFLSALSLSAAPTVRADGGTGSDLLALSGVSDRQVVLTREGEPLRERLSAELFSVDGDLAAWCRPNMPIRYVVDGLTRFRGLTDAAEWAIVAGTRPAVGQLSLRADGLDKVFAKAPWPGGQPWDGRRLTDCLVDLARAAGLGAGQYVIVDDPFRLPDPPAGLPPTFVFRAGTPLDCILEQVRRDYFGQWLRSYWRTSDGCWVVDYQPAAAVWGEPAATFHETARAALVAGAADRVVLAGSYQEVLDESQMANVVTVVGQAPDGAPLTARCVDWASIRDRTAANYVGEVWPLVVADGALSSQTAVNYVCRSRFEQVRWPRVLAQFRSVRVDLQPGDVVRLEGPSFGALYRLRGIHLEQASDGDAADPLGRAGYSLEKLT